MSAMIMSSGSLFLNKIKPQNDIEIPVYNIIGEGCSWEESTWGRIVKNDSAYLSFAKN
jgi:hypothetical protein